MQSYDRVLDAILNTDVQYHVPVYQRPYEWDHHRWDRLWNDIHATIRKRHGNQPAYRHFFGSVVLEQMHFDEVTRFSLIDGQQRLTTALLLSKAMLDEAIQQFPNIFTAATRPVERLRAVLFNTHVNVGNSPRRTKLYPSERDRRDFFGIMEVQGQPFPQQGRMHTAYQHFRRLYSNWLGEQADAEKLRQTEAILDNLFSGFQVTRSELNNWDECYSIFESLNSVAMPLRDSDKVRNYCFKQIAALQEDSVASFYRQCWATMEEAVTPVLKSEEMPAHLDLLMWHWCQMRSGQQFGADRVYDNVMALCDREAQQVDQNQRAELIRGIFEDLTVHAAAFRALQWPDDGFAPVGEAAAKQKVLNLTGPIGLRSAAHPLLLALIRRYLSTEPRDLPSLLSCLDTIESYLVRRIVCDVAIKQHNRIFTGLAHEVNQRRTTPLPEVAQFLQTSLATRSNTTDDRWPRDDEFREGFVSRDFYRQGGKAKFTKALLMAIERRRPGCQVADFTNYEIEHIMADVLTNAWRQHLGANADRIHREYRNRFGNLTLLEAGLNNGQGLLDEKRQVYQNCACIITQEVCLNQDWNTATIEARAQQMFESARLIWPRP